MNAIQGLCVDTCVVVDLFDRYPPVVFKGLVRRLQTEFQSGILTSIDKVHDELMQGRKHTDQELSKLLGVPLSDFFRSFDQAAADQLSNLTPDSRAYRSKRPTKKNADPYLVAWCRAHDQVLLTNDKDLVKAAGTDGVDTLTFVALMKARGWTF